MIISDERRIAAAERIRVSSTGPFPVLIKSENRATRIAWLRKRSITRRVKPEKYFTRKSFAVETGWLKRKDLVFLANSFVNEIEPRNREKRMGRMI